MGKLQRRLVFSCLAVVLAAPAAAGCGCGPEPAAWPGTGIWAGDVTFPGAGNKYAEVVLDIDGMVAVSAHEGEGSPRLEGLSFRGYYSIDGDELTINLEERWSGAAWQSAGSTMTLVVIVDDILNQPFPDSGSRRKWSIDFDQDGAVDQTWTLMKKQDLEGDKAASMPEIQAPG